MLDQSVLDALAVFATHARQQIFGRTNPELKGKIVPLPRSDGALRELVERIERSPAFERLVRAIQDSKPDSPQTESWYWACETDVRHILRQSRFYQRCRDPQATEDDLLGHIRAAFGQEPTTSVQLAAIEHTEFARQVVDCGAFLIRRYTPEQLSDLLRNDTNRIFYPDAATDIDWLSRFWFVTVASRNGEAAPLPDKPAPDFAIAFADSSHASGLEGALEALMLFDWHGLDYFGAPESPPHGFSRFLVPAVFSVDDAISIPPFPAPPLNKFDRLELSDIVKGDFFEPAWRAILPESGCEELQSHCRRVYALRDSLRGFPEWVFVNTAISHLKRGFESYGGDAVLWHCVALETLLGGGSREPVTRTVSRRLGRILGRSNAEVKAIGRRFKEIYRLRCDLVHGKRFRPESCLQHLEDLRDFARSAAMWMLRVGNIVATESANDASPIRRSDLMAVLDMDQESRNRIPRLLASLSPLFPHLDRL